MLELSNIQGSLLLPDFSPCSTKETSAVHHLWCRILLLLQLWGWCRSPLSLPPFSPHTSVQGEEEGHLLSSAMFLPREGSCGFRKICPWGECSLDHNLACMIPNLLFFFFTWPFGFPAHIFQSVFDRRIWVNYQRTAFFVLLLQHGQCCWCSWGQEKSWQMWNFSLIKARKCKERKEILTSFSVLLTNTCSDSWPVPEFFNGFIIHSCWLQWNLG